MDTDNNYVIFNVIMPRTLANDDKALKAREKKLIENLNFFLRNYNRLLAIGYRKAVLDAEIRWLKEELKKMSRRI
ncbi:MAG: hypothetical protein LBB62_06775 [Proteiniphilum sp.]|nr:hypothetical protein [Proteiniphilum sp.]